MKIKFDLSLKKRLCIEELVQKRKYKIFMFYA